MKSIVGVYESHTKAVNAVNELKSAGFPVKNISIIGKAVFHEPKTLDANQLVEQRELSLGVVAGSILGVLTGVGIFAIPGLGFLYGAGALIGAIAGFDIGLIGGGVVAILIAIGIDEASSLKYEKLMQEDKFIVIIQGSPEEVKQAKDILHTSEEHTDIHLHL